MPDIFSLCWEEQGGSAGIHALTDDDTADRKTDCGVWLAMIMSIL